MEIIFTIQFHHAVVKYDIPQLSLPVKRRIQKAIHTKLATHPELFGKPLRQSLRGYRKLRVGDYRVIFRIEGTAVKILAILHHSIVYDRIGRRPL